jgi:hypothetical protein
MNRDVDSDFCWWRAFTTTEPAQCERLLNVNIELLRITDPSRKWVEKVVDVKAEYLPAALEISNKLEFNNRFSSRNIEYEMTRISSLAGCRTNFYEEDLVGWPDGCGMIFI